MAGQTSVAAPAAALAGAIAYPMRPNIRGSVINGDPASIAHGLGVVRDGADNTVDLPTATGEITAGTFRGISFRDPTAEYDSAGIAAGDAFTIVEKGFVWVQVEDAVVQGGAVFCRFIAGGNGIGSIRSDADAGDAVAIPNAKFASSQATADGLAIVELN